MLLSLLLQEGVVADKEETRIRRWRKKEGSSPSDAAKRRKQRQVEGRERRRLYVPSKETDGRYSPRVGATALEDSSNSMVPSAAPDLTIYPTALDVFDDLLPAQSAAPVMAPTYIRDPNQLDNQTYTVLSAVVTTFFMISASLLLLTVIYSLLFLAAVRLGTLVVVVNDQESDDDEDDDDDDDLDFLQEDEDDLYDQDDDDEEEEEEDVGGSVFAALRGRGRLERQEEEVERLQRLRRRKKFWRSVKKRLLCCFCWCCGGASNATGGRVYVIIGEDTPRRIYVPLAYLFFVGPGQVSPPPNNNNNNDANAVRSGTAARQGGNREEARRPQQPRRPRQPDRVVTLGGIRVQHTISFMTPERRRDALEFLLHDMSCPVVLRSGSSKALDSDKNDKKQQDTVDEKEEEKQQEEMEAGARPAVGEEEPLQEDTKAQVDDDASDGDSKPVTVGSDEASKPKGQKVAVLSARKLRRLQRRARARQFRQGTQPSPPLRPTQEGLHQEDDQQEQSPALEPPTTTTMTTTTTTVASLHSPLAQETMGGPDNDNIDVTCDNCNGTAFKTAPMPTTTFQDPEENRPQKHKDNIVQQPRVTLLDSQVCCICLDEYEVGETCITSLGCVHHFHRDCITGWLMTRNNTACPCCRVDLVYNDQVERVCRRLEILTGRRRRRPPPLRRLVLPPERLSRRRRAAVQRLTQMSASFRRSFRTTPTTTSPTTTTTTTTAQQGGEGGGNEEEEEDDDVEA